MWDLEETVGMAEGFLRPGQHGTSVYQEEGREKRPCEEECFKEEKAVVLGIKNFEFFIKCPGGGVWNKQLVA